MIFRAFDRDQNGRIDRAEFERWHRARRLDAKGAAALFSAMDSNQDGFISVEEYKQLVRAVLQERQPRRPWESIIWRVLN